MCLKKRASFYLNLELKYWSSKLESSVDMPNYCVAVGCKNTAKKGSEYSFHRFPHQNPNLLKKWVHAIHRKQWKPTKHSCICSDHFHESCFVIRPGAEAIANAKQASKQAIRYNEHTKQFALTLHYYSPRAHDFVRQVLLLPIQVVYGVGQHLLIVSQDFCVTLFPSLEMQHKTIQFCQMWY